jgi:DNA polymerase III epsilon subunit-like protein
MYSAQSILVIDLETTGLDPFRHACIEIGAVLLEKGLTPLAEFTSLVAPWDGAEVMDAALQVSGISRESFTSARPIVDVINEFHAAFCNQPEVPIIAGWNVWFDVAFLRDMYLRAGLDWPFGHRFIDVQSISAFFSNLRPASQESAIRDMLCETQVHRALDDTYHTARILKYMAENYLPTLTL